MEGSKDEVQNDPRVLKAYLGRNIWMLRVENLNVFYGRIHVERCKYKS